MVELQWVGGRVGFRATDEEKSARSQDIERRFAGRKTCNVFSRVSEVAISGC
jgi:hypothetical protein